MEEKKRNKVRMVFMTPEDFNKIAGFISSMNIPFLKAADAVEVKAAVERAKLIDLREEDEDQHNNTKP